MKLGTQIAIVAIIITILISVLGFTFRQSDQISRNDVRIENLEKDFGKVEKMQEDISCIKENLARLTAILEQKLTETKRK